MRFAVLAVVAALVAASVAGAASRPSLRIVKTDPLVVRGSSFHPRERVRVTARFGTTTRARSTRSSASGGFVLGLGAIPGFDPCNDSLAVTAVGATGDRAAMKLPQRECPPALTP